MIREVKNHRYQANNDQPTYQLVIWHEGIEKPVLEIEYVCVSGEPINLEEQTRYAEDYIKAAKEGLEAYIFINLRKNDLFYELANALTRLKPQANNAILSLEELLHD